MRLSRGMLAVLCVALVVVAVPAWAQDEPVITDPIVIDEPTVVDVSASETLVLIEIEEAGYYLITMAGVGGTSTGSLQLLDAERESLEFDFDDAGIAGMLLPGTYYARASGFGGSQEVQVTVARTTRSFGPGVTTLYEGAVSDTRSFRQRVPLTENDLITVLVLGFGAFDPTVVMLSPSGEAVAGNDDHRSEEPLLSFTDAGIFFFPVPETGTYEFEVRPAFRGGGNATMVLTNFGRLNIGGDEVEIEGEISTVSSGGRRTFDVTLERNDIVRVIVRATDPRALDPAIVVSSPDGDPLAGNDDTPIRDGDIALASTDAQIPFFVVPADGTYLFDIYAVSGGGEFELYVARIGRFTPIAEVDPDEVPDDGTDQPNA